MPANQTTWIPGESGNPDGRKAQRKWQETLLRAIAQDDGQRLRMAVEKLLNLAADGEPWAIKELADRLDGKPAQQLIATDMEGRSVHLGLVAYAAEPQVRSGDTLPIRAAALPAPDIEGPGPRH